MAAFAKSWRREEDTVTEKLSRRSDSVVLRYLRKIEAKLDRTRR
jgi:hypothetical protein